MADPANVVQLRNALKRIEEAHPERAQEIRKTALSMAISYSSRKGRWNVKAAVECAAAFAAFLADGEVDIAPSQGV